MDRGQTGAEAGFDASLYVLRGDPVAIRASAICWQAFGQGAEAAALAVRAVAAISAVEFLGDEGVSHSDRLRTHLAAGLTIVADAWQQVGRALTGYAEELQDCQDELRRLGNLAAADQLRVAARQTELGRAQAADAAHAAALARPPHVPTRGTNTAVAVRTGPIMPSTWTSGAPSSRVALLEAQSALTAVRERALDVRRRHDRAQQACCRAIDQAKALAPTTQPGIRGTGGAGRHVLASVGTVPVLVSLRRGLRVAAAASTGYVDQVAFALRGGARFASAHDDGAADSDDPATLPSPEQLQKIHDGLFAACMMQYTTSLAGDEAGDQYAACLGFADSAVSDRDSLALALRKYPQAGHPTVPHQTKWEAFCEGLGIFVGTVADVVGVGDCIDGDLGPCIGDIAMTVFPFGRMGKIGKQVVEELSDAERVAAGSTKAADDAARARAADRAGALRGAGYPDHISGYTRHGQEQALARDGVGVSDDAMADAVAHPQTEPTLGANGGIRYEGKDAVVVLNNDGLVITTWATGRAGWRKK